MAYLVPARTDEKPLEVALTASILLRAVICDAKESNQSNHSNEPRRKSSWSSQPSEIFMWLLSFSQPVVLLGTEKLYADEGEERDRDGR